MKTWPASVVCFGLQPANPSIPAIAISAMIIFIFVVSLSLGIQTPFVSIVHPKMKTGKEFPSACIRLHLIPAVALLWRGTSARQIAPAAFGMRIW
jgi:hypothetical protein